MTPSVPVIFAIFNRPDTTRRVFETIRAAKPTKLLVVADGPRVNRPGEDEKCAATRAIIDEIDWDCEVQTNFSETNMGCRLRVSSGITWAFELVDKAIILEDDTVPSASFFAYCAELLDRYESDERVMTVGGKIVYSDKLRQRIATTSREFRTPGAGPRGGEPGQNTTST